MWKAEKQLLQLYRGLAPKVQFEAPKVKFEAPEVKFEMTDDGRNVYSEMYQD